MSDEPTKKKRLYDKWGLIVALGMGGLSLSIWVTYVFLRP